MTKSRRPRHNFYREKVAPILAENCMTCHGPKSKLKADLFLGSREGLLKGGESGPAVDLDDPAESLLIGAINYGDYEMPPKAKMSDEKIGILTKWVKMGIPIPRDAETARPRIEKAGTRGKRSHEEVLVISTHRQSHRARRETLGVAHQFNR